MSLVWQQGGVQKKFMINEQITLEELKEARYIFLSYI